MEEDDDKEGKERVEATAEKMGSPGEDNDGVVGEGNDGKHQEYHEIAQHFEP